MHLWKKESRISQNFPDVRNEKKLFHESFASAYLKRQKDCDLKFGLEMGSEL